MKPEYIDLTWWQVSIAATLILINVAISIFIRLRLEGRLMIAAIRLTIQLVLVGYLLQWIFSIDQPLAVLSMVSLMTIIAGVAAVERIDWGYPGILASSLVSVWASSWVVAAIAVLMVIRPEPWWQAQYLIPLLGMILGNALTDISLGMDRLLSELRRERESIDGSLCLGATRWEAFRPSIQAAMRTGMIPILNAMSVAGIVSLPGMMTGQLLSGVEPLAAVRYQIVIMFLIAASVALGTLSAILLSYRCLTSSDHAVRWALIESKIG